METLSCRIVRPDVKEHRRRLDLGARKHPSRLGEDQQRPMHLLAEGQGGDATSDGLLGDEKDLQEDRADVPDRK